MNMSDRYPFIGDKTLITHDGSLVWTGEVAVQSSLDFSNVSDTTLTDSMNEGYVTAIEDNDTQYLSVLETTGNITLEDLHNLTLGHQKIGTQEVLEFNNENTFVNPEMNTVDNGDQQVVIFSVEGSDDLYGIQVTQDEEGNIQKYQFKFRTTEDGQLEAIPESIELLPNEEEVQNETTINEVLVQEMEANESTVVQETPVFFFEDVQEGDVQETQVYIQQQEETTEEYVDFPQEEENLTVYIKGERDSPDFANEKNEEVAEYTEDQKQQIMAHEKVQYKVQEEIHQEEHYEEVEDIKPGIVESDSLSLREASTNIKHELLQEEIQDQSAFSEESDEYHPYQTPEEMTHPESEEHAIHDEQTQEPLTQDEHYAAMQMEDDEETVLQYQQFMPSDIQQVYEGSNTTDSQNLQENNYEPLFIQDTNIPNERSEAMAAAEEEEDEQFVAETGTENDSDNDEYQIVEGLHITAEGDIGDDTSLANQEPATVLQEVIKKPPAPERANILKQKSLLKPIREIKPKITNKTLVYYVVPHLEKENVNSLPVNNALYQPIKTNPRTILKSSFPEVKNEVDKVKTVVDERMHKRFARSKEAVQARLFNNFISKTTIPHAPIRQTRLPRKQQIKPVDTRRNEEIIVQEVMVSSKGFIENVEEKLRNKDKLEVTGYVVLTDSDDDYDPKQGNKKKKKYKKHRKAEVSDTDSDGSVIEIHSDEELEEESQQDKDKQSNPKRGRGRPKKSSEMNDDSESTKRRRGRPPKTGGDLEESPTKKSRTESDDDGVKKEINCPHCTKTFPNQNSLSTHIQHHNLENSLRNKVGVTRSLEYKHKCDDCQLTFKNSILLKRHVCEKQVSKVKTKLECTLCKKTFPTVFALNVHKRGHVKENLVNMTSVTKVSPKKISPRASTNQVKFIKPSVVKSRTFKCTECSRVCYSQESLAFHEKTHKKYMCNSCGTSFPSRLLLDTHVRVSCVKMTTATNKKLSFKIRKSFVQSPRRKSTKFPRRSALPVMNSTLNLNSSVIGLNSTLGMKLECSVCGEKFQTFQDKFKHQVKVHGMETPDKSILAEQKKQLHKPKNLHGGIPARDSMRKAFATMKTKIVLATPLNDSN